MDFIASSSKSRRDVNVKCMTGMTKKNIYEGISVLLLAKKGYELSKDANSNICDFAVFGDIDIRHDRKFNYIVFRYINRDNTEKFIFVHVVLTQFDRLINFDVLSNDARRKGQMHKDFNLKKHFIAFLNLKEKLKKEKSKTLTNEKLHFVTFTNGDLDVKDLKSKGFLFKPAPNDITELFSTGKSSTMKNEYNNCYQFHDANKILYKLFNPSSDIHRLARELAKYVIWKHCKKKKIMGIDTFPIMRYHVALGNKVIQKSRQVMSDIETRKGKTEIYCEGRFREDFIDNEVPGPEKTLRDAILQAVRKLHPSIRDANDKELKVILKEVKLKLVPDFGEIKHTDNFHLFYEFKTVREKDIDDFLNCLVFVVTQPRMEELQALINEPGRNIVLEGSAFKQANKKLENIGSEIMSQAEKSLGIHEKTVHKEGWIYGEEIINFVENEKQFISESSVVTAMTLIYENETMQYGQFLEKTKIAEEFLSSNSNVLCVYTPSTLLTSIKILQYLNNKNKYLAYTERISISSDILKCEKNRRNILKSFESEYTSLLTIECRDVVSEQNVREFYNELCFVIIKTNASKKVVLIIEQDKHNILAEKFRNDFYSMHLYTQEKDEINLNSFMPRADPLQKKLIVLQGKEKKVSLGSVIGLTTWDSYVNNLSKIRARGKYDVLDIMTFVKILKNEEIIVGSKPLDTSFLQGSYATLFEEINLDTLSYTLLDENNTHYKFVFSGIMESEEETKKEKLINLLGLGSKRKIIEDKVGHIGSDSKIQIADDYFKDENFEDLCHSYPKNIFYWIHLKSEDNKYQFMLQKLYDPTFYVKRKYKKIAFENNLIDLLMKNDLSETFIFSPGDSYEDKKKFNELKRELNLPNDEALRINIDYNFKYKTYGKTFFSPEDSDEDIKFNELIRKLNLPKDEALRINIDDDFKYKMYGKTFFSPEDSDEDKNFSELIEELSLTKGGAKQMRIDDISIWKTSGLDLHFFTNEFPDYFLSNVHRCKNKTVHWIKFECGQFIWYDSCGSVVELRKYIDRNLCTEYLSDDCLFHYTGFKKIIILAGNPGMGKSTTLIKLYESIIRPKFRSHWVIRINLKDHLQAVRDVFEDKVSENDNMDVSDAIEFLCKVDIKLNDSLDKILLRRALEQNIYPIMLVLLAFDGFDEVLDERDRAKIISLFKFLKNKTRARIWITTSLQFRETLEDALGTFAFELNPLDDEEKMIYMEKYLKHRLCFILNKDKFKECFPRTAYMKENKRLLKYTETILSTMKSDFNDNLFTFISIPLHLHLILEGSIRNFKKWIECEDDKPNFDYLGNDICEIYEKFLDRKLDIYLKKFNIEDPIEKKEDKFIFNQCNKDLAKALIFNSKQKKTFVKFKGMILSVGIVKFEHEKFDFLHPNLRDFFAAKIFFQWIKKDQNQHIKSTKHEYLLTEILMKPDYKLIRAFLNNELGKNMKKELPEETWKQFGKIIVNLLKQEQNPLIIERVTVLHIAASESNSKIIYFILKCLENHQDVLQSLLFKQDRHLKTVLRIACENSDLKVVTLLLDAATRISEDALEKFINLTSCQTDINTNYIENAEILKELLKRAKNKLEFIMNKYNYSLVIAYLNNDERIAKILFDEFKHDKISLKQLLLYRYDDGNSLWWAACHTSLVEYLISLAKEICDNNETLKMLLLNEGGYPLLSRVTSFGDINAVKIVINAAKAIHDDNRTLQQILLPEDSTHTALHSAAIKGHCGIIQLLLETVTHLNDGQILLEEFIFAENKEGENAIQLIVKFKHDDIFEGAFKMLEEERFHNIQEKVKQIFDKVYCKFVLKKET